MSGIAAIYSRSRSFDPHSVGQMAEVMRHRGPDDFGTWVHDNVGLAACLFKTTPESRQEQPIAEDRRQQYHLVWDGRIDNREELIRNFSNEWNEEPDPSLFLEAYGKWGFDCLKKIVGEFAFALWDENQKTLFCGRDRIGIKPLHYFWDGRDFFMASEIKSLLTALPAMPKPDDAMILSFLSYRNFTEEDSARTFLKDIHRLPGGHYLLLKEGRLEIQKYWSIHPERVDRYPSDGDCIDAFRAIFSEAVRCRLRSISPVGFLLSGGMDSSSIVSTAAKFKNEAPPLEAVTLFTNEKCSDERLLAREVAQQCAVPLHEVFTRSHDSLKGIDNLIRHAEAPMIAACHEDEPENFIRSRGLQVLITGEAGDQLLDEYGFPADLVSNLRLFEVYEKTKIFAEFYEGSTSVFLKQALSEMLPAWLLQLRRRILKNLPPAWIQPRLAHEVNLAHRIRQSRIEKKFHSFVQAGTYRSLLHPYALYKWEMEERLYAYDRIDIRRPFLDSRLIEFVLALPWEKRASGVRKGILRESMRGTVPEKVLWRKGKGDWSDEMDDALLAACRLNPPAPLQNVSEMMERYLDFEEVRRLVAHFVAGERGLRFEIWFIIAMDHWLNLFSKGGFHGEEPKKEKIQFAGAGEVR